MVVDDLDIFGSGLGPSKADSILVIDADTVLPNATAFQRFQPVSRRNLKIAQPPRLVEDRELSHGDRLDLPEPRHSIAAKQRL